MDSCKGSLRDWRPVWAMGATAALLAAACGTGEYPQSKVTTSPDATPRINPARIDRVRHDLPDGYEVATLTGQVRPPALWGFGTQWSAEPPHCGLLADPAVDPASTMGWSASGTGGIVYVVVAQSTAGLDPEAAAACGKWTLSAGQANGTVTMTAAPAIENAETVAMATATTTVVEGGTETHSHAETVTAYLDGHVAFVSVVTDPGSPHPQLDAAFANELMAKTAAALRG